MSSVITISENFAFVAMARTEFLSGRATLKKIELSEQKATLTIEGNLSHKVSGGLAYKPDAVHYNGAQSFDNKLFENVSVIEIKCTLTEDRSDEKFLPIFAVLVSEIVSLAKKVFPNLDTKQSSLKAESPSHNTESNLEYQYDEKAPPAELNGNLT